MDISTQVKISVRAELCDRIDRLARELPHLGPGTLAFAVDDIRRIARANDMHPLAELAHALESAIARSHGGAMILPFLEAMGDAVGCERIDPAAAQSYLASVGIRLHG